MQTWQLFILLKQNVHISLTVFSNLTKLTNYLFKFINGGIISEQKRLTCLIPWLHKGLRRCPEKMSSLGGPTVKKNKKNKYLSFTLVGLPVPRPVKDHLTVLLLNNRLYIPSFNLANTFIVFLLRIKMSRISRFKST